MADWVHALLSLHCWTGPKKSRSAWPKNGKRQRPGVLGETSRRLPAPTWAKGGTPGVKSPWGTGEAGSADAGSGRALRGYGGKVTPQWQRQRQRKQDGAAPDA